MIRRVPVPCGKDGQPILLSGLDVLIERSNDAVTAVYGEASTSKEIVLEIYDE
jgi:hypothetical protein